MMDSVFDKVDIRDKSSRSICHFDLMLPVDRAAHVKEEIVTHESMPDLQRALDDSVRANHLSADFVEVIDGPVTFFTEGAEVLFHLLEHLLCVTIAA